LAVSDDLGAILVIALFLPRLSHQCIYCALVIVAIMALLNYSKVYKTIYIVLGFFFGSSFYQSGLHATLLV
jgi:Na+/H+ antiporter NhaA